MAKRQINKAKATDPAILQEIIDASLAIDEERQSALLDRMYGVVKIFANPAVLGARNIPEGPVLYIGNHSTMAFDVLVAAPALQRASGRSVRGMSDEILYRSPKIREGVTNRSGI